MTSENFLMDLLNEGSSTPQNNQAEAPASSLRGAAEQSANRVEALIAALRASGRDITATYEDWLKVGFALAGEYGESGRAYFHDICYIYPDYSRQECDTKYDECLKSEKGRTDISTLFYLAKQQGVTLPKSDPPRNCETSSKHTEATSDKNVAFSERNGQTAGLNIPERSDIERKLNVALSFVETSEEDRALPSLPESVFDDLPSLLREAVSSMNTQQEKDLVLIGSIATLSCALLPLRTIFHGRTIFPNIYLFVPGPAGSGKGRLDFCWRLVKPIHEEKRELWQLAVATYKEELERYRNLPRKDKSNASIPIQPPITLLRVQANTSATSFAQVMADNGNMIMFETEGDTVVNTFKSDYGNYSDNFRKAYAHEEFGYLRRGNDNEEREIQNPRLSVVLSGTPEQVKSLIPNAENGLLSRFIFYCLSATDEWIDGFSGYNATRPLEKVFDDLGGRFKDFYHRLNTIPEVSFTLSFVQQQKFNDYFKAEKARMRSLNGDLYTASSHRLSWAALRIAMVLTALRMMDTGNIPDRIECSDTDFDITMSIIRTVTEHNDYIFNILSGGTEEEVKVSETYSSAARATLLTILPDTFTSKDMREAAVRINKTIRTVERQIRRAIQSGQVKELGRGSYQKIKST